MRTSRWLVFSVTSPIYTLCCLTFNNEAVCRGLVRETALVCVSVYMKQGGLCDSASKTKRNSLRSNRGCSQKPHTVTKAIMLKPLSVLPTLRLLKCSQILSKETLQLLLTGKVTTEVYKSLEAFCLASFRMITRGKWGRFNSSRRQPFKRGNNWVQISFRYVFNHSMITDIVVCPWHFYSQAPLICTHNCAICFTHSKAQNISSWKGTWPTLTSSGQTRKFSGICSEWGHQNLPVGSLHEW